MWRNSRITEEQGKAMSPKALVRDQLLQGKQSVKMNFIKVIFIDVTRPLI